MLFQKILEVFTEEVDGKKKEDEKEQPKTVAATETPEVVKADKKVYDIIYKSIQNEESLFFKLVELMPPESLVSEESKRFKTAFLYLQKQSKSATPDIIIQDLQGMINSLGEEKNKFDKALEDRRSLITQMVKDHDLVIQRVEELEQELKKSQAHIEEINSKIEEEKKKITKSQEGFDLALKDVENKLNTQKEKVKNFLK